MKNKVIIFGAFGALGRGVTSVLLNKKNYDHFYLFDFNAESQHISDERVKTVNIQDLSFENNVKAAFDKIERSDEDVYLLYSTIGGFIAGIDVKDMKVDNLDKMFNINMKSNFLIAKYFISLRGRKGGAICFTSAYSAFTPEAGRAAYGASKSALNYIIQSLSEECLSNKISVTGIAPFRLDTPENREWMNETQTEAAQKPEEVGELVDFIFKNYHFLSGNIFSLKNRFNQ